MARRNVIVTGIGGNVGQGIIRNIRSLHANIRVIGTNIADFSPGNYLCDAFYKVPYAYEKGYLEAVANIALRESADLLIPSTDYEAFYLSIRRGDLPCRVAVSGPESTRLYLDKYESWIHHRRHDIPFARSVLPSAFSQVFSEYIVKPRKGRGSREIHINPRDLSRFSDSEYVVQELLKGEEITTAFYVTTDRELNGIITLSRMLENGTTSQCRVVREYDELLLPIVTKMITASDIAGSANIQSIVTAQGEIVPFEVNCRISGTNSIRSNFGFKDVKYTLDEFLFGKKPEKPTITNGVAVRVLLDVIYPGQSDYSNLRDGTASHYLF